MKRIITAILLLLFLSASLPVISHFIVKNKLDNLIYFLNKKLQKEFQLNDAITLYYGKYNYFNSVVKINFNLDQKLVTTLNATIHYGPLLFRDADLQFKLALIDVKFDDNKLGSQYIEMLASLYADLSWKVNVNLKTYSWQQNNSKVDWQDIMLEAIFDNNFKKSIYKAKIPFISASSEDSAARNSFMLKNLVFTSNITRHSDYIWLGNSNLMVDNINMASDKDKMLCNITGVDLNGKIHLSNKNKIDISNELQLGNVDFKGADLNPYFNAIILGPLSVKFILTALDIDEIQKFYRQLENNNTDNQDLAAQQDLILDFINGMLNYRPGVKFNLDVTFPEGKTSQGINLNIGGPNIGANDLMQLINSIGGEVYAIWNKELAHKFVAKFVILPQIEAQNNNYTLQHEGALMPKPVYSLDKINTMTQEWFQMMIKNNFLEVEGENYKSRIVIHDGKFAINSRPEESLTAPNSFNIGF